MIEYTIMTEAHVQQVAALEKVCFSEPWSERSIAHELTNPLAYWLVAVEGDRLAGYVGSQSVLDEADMMNIAVEPAYRRQGIAEGLVERLVSHLALTQVRCLTLEVRASNEPAKSLYGNLGFETVGVRKNYYRNPREDALILRKEWSL